MTDLGTLGGNGAYAHDINDQGKIVGESLRPDSLVLQAFRWSNGSMVHLGISQGQRTCATAINNLGQIVGWHDVPGETRGWLFDGGLIDLGNLGAAVTRPEDINVRGEIVGTSLTAGLPAHAFLWRAGTMIDIGAQLGSYNTAHSINASGDVVGGSPAFLHKEGPILRLDSLIDQSLGWQPTEATGINDAGMIASNGMHDGQRRAFLLIPAPPPLFVVPGIAGTYAASTWDDIGWILSRGGPPEALQIDPLGRKYENLIKTLAPIAFVPAMESQNEESAHSATCELDVFVGHDCPGIWKV